MELLASSTPYGIRYTVYGIPNVQSKLDDTGSVPVDAVGVIKRVPVVKPVPLTSGYPFVNPVPLMSPVPR
jgi:hypothetical protein